MASELALQLVCFYRRGTSITSRPAKILNPHGIKLPIEVDKYRQYYRAGYVGAFPTSPARFTVPRDASAWCASQGLE